MNIKTTSRLIAALFAAAAMTPLHAASERESLETLRQTTLNLINVLVEQGIMTREKADAVVKAAEQKAAATVAEQQKTAASEKGQVITTSDKGKVRVSFIPDSVKNEIREQVRQEVLAQAKTERWGDPGALPEWIDRIQWEGDIRIRSQTEMMDQANTRATSYRTAQQSVVAGQMTRAADFGTASSNGGIANANTLEDRERMRLRLRLGMNAKVNSDFTAGVRMVTGSATDRVSTNQSLGNNFNKYSLMLDRAYLKYEPNDWISVSGGLIPNPWFGTDLVWDEDLNFEGVAATLGKREGQDTFKPFVTAGFFPLRTENPPVSSARWLTGVQGGFELNVSSRTRFKMGAAYYEYKNIEGRQQTDAEFGANTNYGQYAYESGLRQKGNTLFRTNAPADNTAGNSIWGLASQFKPFNVTAVLDLAHLDPMHLILTADYVKNLGFDKDEIRRRTGLSNVTGKDTGALLKMQYGYPRVSGPHQWNVSAAYRYLGSDAVLDAFADSDFGLGGTNNKGFILGFNYGLARNTTFGARWLSSNSIDSMLPSNGVKANYGVDVMQLDVSSRF